MRENRNPFNVRVSSIVMTKFNGTDKIDITPQMAEFTIYQSVFSTILKADMVMNDAIGLMNNYPLTGEEVIEVTIEQKGEEEKGTNQKEFTKTLQFVITAIKDIKMSDDTRKMLYVIELASIEAFYNSKVKVSHAYYDKIEEIIKQVFSTYIQTNTDIVKQGFRKEITTYNETQNKFKIVVPSLKPLDAINWLSKYAVATEKDQYYTYSFYETLNGFVFKALQFPTYKTATGGAAPALADNERYFYISNLELVMNNKELYELFTKEGFDVNRTVNDLKINKRYTTLEKIVNGYFKNELIEVNMLQKDHKVTKSELNNDGGNLNMLENNVLNTEDYMNNVKNSKFGTESSPRIRYVINNFDNLTQPSFRDKFGSSSRSFAAYQQIDLSIAVHADLLLRVGDLMSLYIPEGHGFNANFYKDKYLSGLFLITEIKTVIRNGGASQSYIRLNKDSFSEKLEDKAAYELNIQQDFETQRQLNRASGA